MNEEQAEAESKGCLIVLGAIAVVIIALAITDYCHLGIGVLVLLFIVAGISNISNKNVS